MEDSTMFDGNEGAEAKDGTAPESQTPSGVPAPPQNTEEALPLGWERRENADGQTYYFDRATKGISSTRPRASDYVEKLIEEALPVGWQRRENKLGVYYIDHLTKNRTRKRPKPSDYPGGRTMAEEPPPTREIPRPYRLPSLGAQKLGPSFNYLYEYTNRSGFSPPPSLAPQPPLSPVSDTRATPFNNYAKRFMSNFSLGELYDVGAIDPYDARAGENTLSNDILPLLTDNWITPGKPMQGKPGRFWDMNDPEVSVAMKPILRLVSRFITSFNTSDWWDALLMGKRYPVHPKRIPPDVKSPSSLKYFKLRRPEEKVAKPLDWGYLKGRIKFSFDRGFNYHPDFADSHMHFHHGITYQGRRYTRVSVTYGNIEPLMPSFVSGLGKSERLMVNFSVAVTLLHELAHAVNHARNILTGNPDRLPPYFEDEPVAEEGRCMENAIFGGKIDAFPQWVRELKFLGVQAQGLLLAPRRFIGLKMAPWPNWETILRAGMEDDDNPGQDSYGVTLAPLLRGDRTPWVYAVHPIPLAYIEDIQQDLFWDTQVAQFGSEELKVWDRIFGRVNFGKKSDPDFIKTATLTSTWFNDPKNWTGSSSGESSDASNPRPEDSKPKRPVSIREVPIALSQTPDSDFDSKFDQPASAYRSKLDHSGLLYRRKRARESRRIAKAVKARLDESSAIAKYRRKWSSIPEIMAKVKAIREERVSQRRDYKEFYEAHPLDPPDIKEFLLAELEDLMLSKGVWERDLGIGIYEGWWEEKSDFRDYSTSSDDEKIGEDEIIAEEEPSDDEMRWDGDLSEDESMDDDSEGDASE